MYILSAEGIAYFNPNLFLTNVRTIKVKPNSTFLDAIIVGEYLYAACADHGLHVYKILKDGEMAFVGEFGEHDCFDLEYSREQNLLYTLDKTRGICVFSLEVSRPVHIDYINTTKYTNSNMQIKVYENTIIVSFQHGASERHVVAEFSYNRFMKTFTFIRYFKFTYGLTEIQIVRDYFIGVGREYLGVFPTGIHPKLIKY